MSHRFARLAAGLVGLVLALGSLLTAQATASATSLPSLVAALDGAASPPNQRSPLSADSRLVGLSAPLLAPSQGAIRPIAYLTDPASTISRLGTQIGGTPPYLDDRSGGASVILSYYNAIHRQEYDRAYSYWAPTLAASQIGTYAAFKAGFADTQSFSVVIGQVRIDHGAGQIYNFVPVAITAIQRDDSTRAYSGCFSLHLANPQIQNAPPFDPWAIESARVRRLPTGVNPVSSLGTACAGKGFLPPSTAPTPNPNDISSSRYLDDRSTPEAALRSLFNAVNSGEYDRAYSYWEPGAVGLAPYPTFRSGYLDTASVQLRFGQTQVGMGAGQIYLDVPVTLIARTTSRETQTYVGCYTLHLARPVIQDQPPYWPLAVRSASVKRVSNTANTASLMAKACPTR